MEYYMKTTTLEMENMAIMSRREKHLIFAPLIDNTADK